MIHSGAIIGAGIPQVMHRETRPWLFRGWIMLSTGLKNSIQWITPYV